MSHEILNTGQGRKIAYVRRAGAGPGVVFLPGLKSDMEGTKALHLDAFCRARGQAFIRFDYSGHGQSSGTFEAGSIGDWHQDSLAVVDELTEGPQIIVGSSMGGWQALLLARARPERIAGLIGIAAAPDFTEDHYTADFTPAQWDELARTGQVALPSEYGEPMIISQRLLEDGKSHLVLRDPLDLPFMVRLMQGTADEAVPVSQAVKLLNHAQSPDMQLTLVKDADHRFSSPHCLALVEQAVEEITANHRHA